MLRFEGGCCFSQKVVVHLQFGDFLAQPIQFCGFINFQLAGWNLSGALAFCLDPATQQSWVDAQFSGDFRDRPIGVDNQPGCFMPVLRGVLFPVNISVDILLDRPMAHLHHVSTTRG